jgi:hypothetical protein
MPGTHSLNFFFGFFAGRSGLLIPHNETTFLGAFKKKAGKRNVRTSEQE